MRLKPEEAISVACAEWVRLKAQRDERYGLIFSVQNERKTFRGDQWNLKGRVKGVSDWIILCASRTGRFSCGAIELKAGKNKETPEQKAFLDLTFKHGGFAAVCRSFDAFEKIVTKYMEEL